MTAVPAQRAACPIADQVAELAREVRSRQRYYPDLIKRGRLTQVTAEIKLFDLRCALATLELIAAYADGLRMLVRFLRVHQTTEPTATERELLLEHPAVRALVDTFPEARLVSAGPLTRPAADAALTNPDTTEDAA